MFASKVTAQVQIAADGVDEAGVVNIRKMSALALEKASLNRQIAVTQLTRSMGPEMLKALTANEDEKPTDGLEAFPAAKKKVKPVLSLDEQRKARYTLYDRQFVLQAGVVHWTYDTKVSDGLEDLDEDTAQKLHEAILDLSLPPLTEEEREAVSAKD